MPMLRALLVAAALCVAGLPAAAEPSVTILPLDFKASEFRSPRSRVASIIATTDALRDDKSLKGQPLVVVWGAGGGAALALGAGQIRTVPLGGSVADLPTIEHGRDAIPGSRLQTSGAITVTLADPTAEHPHDALGSGTHAKTLVITERRPVAPGPDPRPVSTAVARVSAGDGAVFEDREPRVVDLDGDGMPEILTLVSDRDHGTSLCVIGKHDGTWAILARTPPTGEAEAWLNTAAIADFTGIGHPTIALVERPHRDGILELWGFENGALRRIAQKAGYSNHAFGQPGQDLAALVAGDGPPKLAIPTADRASLALLSLKSGIAEEWRVALPAKAATGVATLGSGRDAHILVGLEDGRVADVRP